MTQVWYRLPHQHEVMFHQGALEPWRGQPGFVIRPWDEPPMVIPGLPTQHLGPVPEPALPPDPDRTTTTSYANYLHTAHALLEALNGPLHKAVLARQSVLQGTFSVAQSFEQLALQRPNAMVYALQHPEHGVWLGATPEILVRQHHHQLEVMSLAGTRPSGTAAPWGEKETMEQSLVTEYIHRIMAEACGEVQVIGPNTLMAGTVEHLCTQLIGVSATANAFQLAEQLHPTPAVCGWPMPAARQWIQAHEGMWRKLYTGYLGPVSHDQALLMVNLRCVNLFSTHAVAYAGGGWVQGSTPELEWEETNRKVASIAAHLVQAP